MIWQVSFADHPFVPMVLKQGIYPLFLVVRSDPQALGNFLNYRVTVVFYEPFGSHLVYVNEMTQSGDRLPETSSRLVESWGSRLETVFY